MKKLFYRRRLSGLAIIFVFTIFQISFLFSPVQANAQLVVANPDLIARDIQKDISDQILDKIDSALISAIGSQLVNLILYSVNQVAQESAIWVASGGQGNRPLFNIEPAEDFLQNAGSAIVAEAYNNLNFESLQGNGGIVPGSGIRLSDDPEYLVAVRQGLKSAYVRPVDNFNFTEIADNYQGYLVSIYESDATSQEKTEAILATMSQSFKSNEFSNGLQFQATTLIDAQAKAEVQKDVFVKNDGFVAQTSPGSNYTELPASFISQDLFNSLQRPQEVAQNAGLALLSGGDNILLGVGQYAGVVFTNTLISELTDKFRGGFFEGIAPTFSDDPFDPNSSNPFSREKAQNLFRSISSFRPLEVQDYNLVSRLSSCPASTLRNSRTLYSCAIDTSFASAVGRAESGVPLTVKEAIEEGYIDGNWPLIPSSDVSANQDTDCRSYGFCHSNLIKMRKARLIPVGWEIAAELGSSLGSPLTLNEAIDGFNDCNADGERDADHETCHLIDENWVLKAPESDCRTLAYGQLLTASGTDSRAEECVDIQSCIDEGDDGTCEGGYGYCTREKNVWRFRGDICPEQYASCLSFDTREGEQVDYLRTTVDFAACDADATGCLWFATQKRVDETDSYDWPVVNDVALADLSDEAYKNRIYFNANVEACDEEGAGCSDVLVRGNDLERTLNLIQNPSFESDTDGDSWPDVWLSDDYANFVYSTDNTLERSGASAIAPGSARLRQWGPLLNQSRFYSFSFYARQPDGATSDNIIANVRLTDEFGEETPNLAGLSIQGSCSAVDLNGDGSFATVQTNVTPAGTDYERFECIFTLPALANKAAQLNTLISFQSSDVVIDDVSLEQTGDPTSFHADYTSNDLRSQTIKIAPDYLGCTGADTDPVECGAYAQVCSPNDVGCELYTPVNGDPAVSGVVSELDICPSSCVNYDTYKQEPTQYEANGEFPLYFIPATAQECSEEAVGCDEFTNLATEEKEYYTFLRSCVTEDQAADNRNGDNGAIYYTWEGSDEEGFQLREWRLLESDLDGAGYNVNDYNDATPGTAPCTNWETDASGINCTDDANGDLTIDSYTDACDAHDDILANPDCREFYDTDGDIHYRDWTETVTVNNACVSYRKTDIAGLGDDNDSNGIDDGEENCTASGGFFDAVANQCRFYGFSEESVTCDEGDNGCRNYTGGRSNNSRLAFEDIFETGTLSNWGANSTVTLSNESIATDGHSLNSLGGDVWTAGYDLGSVCTDPNGCVSGTGSLGASCTVPEGQQYCGTLVNDIFAGKTYTLSFWAKGSGSLEVGLDTDVAAPPTADIDFGDAVELTSLWQHFSVGPLDLNNRDFANIGVNTALVFHNADGVPYYIDNVTLREGEENITIIKDSWVTPATCDVNLEGQSSPQFHLGCSEYTDPRGATQYLKSFRRLCSEDKIGCSAYYRTFESETPNAQILNATCTNPADVDGNGEADAVTERTECYLFNDLADGFDTNSPSVCTISLNQNSCLFDLDFFIPETRLADVGRFDHLVYEVETTVIPADTDYYAIVKSEDICSGSSAGCTELGQPIFSADNSVVETWENAYLINDPDVYNETLCTSEELFCEEYNAGSEGTFYFKDPQNSLCEYRTNVLVNGTNYDGWFTNGTNDFCYGTGTCSDDASACSVNSDCRVNTGICSDSGDVCSQDFDCGQSGFCEGVSAATCVIDDGSHILGGDVSGIWRNGDANYDGQVGVCEPESDTCTEFRDTLDYDDEDFYTEGGGESYFFLNNDRLGQDGLLSGTRCDNQVSQEEGCVLFNDTGDPGNDYNASASYMSSVHASEIFGGQPFDLVAPINCDNGESASIIVQPDGITVDLCAQRCVYPEPEINDITSDYATLVDALAVETDANILYIFGESCYTSNDCSSKESELGVLVNGVCETFVAVNAGTKDVPRLGNDTNKVLKVNRDRVCSEWLACSSSFTVWNEDLGKYQEVCDTIDLCTKSGEGANCVAWDSEDPATVLDIERYTSRDVSWYGEEYSGYAIPDSFPIQHLEQVNIEPAKICARGEETFNTCVDDTDCNGAGVTCVTNTEIDFRLALNAGSCSEPQGESCTVGYCTDDGSACSANSQCESNSCIVGSCFEVTADSCSADTDCGVGASCLGGFCANDVGEDCGLDFACTANPSATCITSTATKSGSCLRGNCLLTQNGNQFDGETSESSVCRAQPEQNSPFSNDLVESWSYYDGSEIQTGEENPDDIFGSKTASKSSALPFDTIAGFENASFCAPGEVCECSYKKVASSTGQSAYVESGTNVAGLGICLGGDASGAFCQVGDDALDCGTSGTCQPITREDTLIGLEGYCLERDTGLNINGDPELGACLTWLPVDQLAGSTDLFAKYTKAGVDEDVFFCSIAKTYDNPTAFKGCSGVRGEDGLGTVDGTATVTSANSDYCRWTTTCPDGYWAIVGDATIPSDEGTESAICENGGGSIDFDTNLWNRSRDACPYMCIPKNSFHADGEVCELSGGRDGRSAYSNTEFWHFPTYSVYDTKVTEFEDCSAYGVEAESSAYGLDSFVNNENLNGSGFEDYFTQPTEYQIEDSYPACKNILQTSSSEIDEYNVAYTDRFLNAGAGYTVDAGEFTYGITTAPLTFGRASSPIIDIEDNYFGIADPTPRVIPACNYDLSDSDAFSSALDLDGACETDYVGVDFGNDGSGRVEAREWVDWETGFPLNNDLTTSDSTTDVANRIAQLFAVPLRMFGWAPDEGSLSVGGAGLGGYDNVTEELDFAAVFPAFEWDDRAANGKPPTIIAIDPNNCFGTKCREGSENQITVNNQNVGDLDGSDGFIRATVKFFAAADKNQLPIRRVIVDWGDDSNPSGSPDAENFYKNHRGLQPESQSESWCDTDNEWGMTSESCDDNFFNYSHNYFCSETILNGLDTCTDDDGDGNIDFSPCAEANSDGIVSCAFRPAVHVRDNWGWCAGSCDASLDGGDTSLGCFADNGTLTTPGFIDECDYNSYPDGNLGIDPWIHYNGTVYVEPS